MIWDIWRTGIHVHHLARVPLGDITIECPRIFEHWSPSECTNNGQWTNMLITSNKKFKKNKKAIRKTIIAMNICSPRIRTQVHPSVLFYIPLGDIAIERFSQVKHYPPFIQQNQMTNEWTNVWKYEYWDNINWDNIRLENKKTCRL